MRFTGETSTGCPGADAVIAEVSQPSLGVGYEIGVAEKIGKPILCLFDESQSEFRLSAMLSGNPKVQVIRYRAITSEKANLRVRFPLVANLDSGNHLPFMKLSHFISFQFFCFCPSPLSLKRSGLTSSLSSGTTGLGCLRLHRDEGGKNSGHRSVGQRIHHDDPLLLQRIAMRPLRQGTLHGVTSQNNGVLANARKEKREGVRNIADHLIPLGYKVGLSGKKHFGLGTAEIDAIPGFASGANGSNQVHSFDGVEEYVSQAKRNGHSFCVIIGATHAHHPWDHGRESNFPTDQIELRPTTLIRRSIGCGQTCSRSRGTDQQVRETRELMDKMDLEKDTILIFRASRALPCPGGNGPRMSTVREPLPRSLEGANLPRKTTALAMYCDIVPTLIDFVEVKTLILTKVPYGLMDERGWKIIVRKF